MAREPQTSCKAIPPHGIRGIVGLCLVLILAQSHEAAGATIRGIVALEGITQLDVSQQIAFEEAMQSLDDEVESARVLAVEVGDAALHVGYELQTLSEDSVEDVARRVRRAISNNAVTDRLEITCKMRSWPQPISAAGVPIVLAAQDWASAGLIAGCVVPMLLLVAAVLIAIFRFDGVIRFTVWYENKIENPGGKQFDPEEFLKKFSKEASNVSGYNDPEPVEEEEGGLGLGAGPMNYGPPKRASARNSTVPTPDPEREDGGGADIGVGPIRYGPSAAQKAAPAARARATPEPMPPQSMDQDGQAAGAHRPPGPEGPSSVNSMGMGGPASTSQRAPRAGTVISNHGEHVFVSSEQPSPPKPAGQVVRDADRGQVFISAEITTASGAAFGQEPRPVPDVRSIGSAFTAVQKKPLPSVQRVQSVQSESIVPRGSTRQLLQPTQGSHPLPQPPLPPPKKQQQQQEVVVEEEEEEDPPPPPPKKQLGRSPGQLGRSIAGGRASWEEAAAEEEELEARMAAAPSKGKNSRWSFGGGRSKVSMREEQDWDNPELAMLATPIIGGPRTPAAAHSAPALPSRARLFGSSPSDAGPQRPPPPASILSPRQRSRKAPVPPSAEDLWWRDPPPQKASPLRIPTASPDKGRNRILDLHEEMFGNSPGPVMTDMERLPGDTSVSLYQGKGSLMGRMLDSVNDTVPASAKKTPLPPPDIIKDEDEMWG